MFVGEGIKWRRFFSFYFLHWRGKKGFEFLYVIRVFESDFLSVKSCCGCKGRSGPGQKLRTGNRKEEDEVTVSCD
jgi:hypothetical protein